MSVMANGWGSREKARIALKRIPHAPRQDENAMILNASTQSDEETADAKPIASSVDMPQILAAKKSIVRLEVIYTFIFHSSLL